MNMPTPSTTCSACVSTSTSRACSMPTRSFMGSTGSARCFRWPRRTSSGISRRPTWYSPVPFRRSRKSRSRIASTRSAFVDRAWGRQIARNWPIAWPPSARPTRCETSSGRARRLPAGGNGGARTSRSRASTGCGSRSRAYGLKTAACRISRSGTRRRRSRSSMPTCWPTRSIPRRLSSSVFSRCRSTSNSTTRCRAGYREGTT